ncbi:restriction endonuclease subunit S [Lactococcus lactis]|uniref:restriction endonuclease subunit S n=1 Tax=Lactococcus lactis TaxID=1358 RepID=UPI00034A72C6|nr:restriction endonuclease subunit S [Lactococcus lactis]
MTSNNNLNVEKNKAEVSKNVPELRFQGFIDAWEQRKFGELLTEVKRPIKMQDDDTYQLVTVKRRNEGIVSRGLFKGKQILVKNYFELHAGDYLISKRQVVHGANGIVPKEMEGAIVSNEYLVSVGNKNITTDFLTIISKLPIMYKMFFLSSYGIDIEKLVFNVNDWKKKEISIPSLQEQNRISSIFKQLDDTITLHQRKLDKLKQLKQGYLQQLLPKNDEKVPRVRFTNFENEWEPRKLKDLGIIQTGNTPKTSNAENYNDNGVLWITPTDIEYLITNNSAKKLSAKGYSKARIADSGSILVTCIASIGKNTLVEEPSGFNQQINSVTPNKLNNSYFLLTQSELWSTKMKGIASSGTMQIVNKNDFSNLLFLYPKLEEQKKIGSFFKQLDYTIALHQSKLDKLKLLKQGLLQKMFL